MDKTSDCGVTTRSEEDAGIVKHKLKPHHLLFGEIWGYKLFWLRIFENRKQESSDILILSAESGSGMAGCRQTAGLLKR
jgi:hypothetical protein